MVKYDQASAQRGQRYIEDRRGSGGRRRSRRAPVQGGGLPVGKVSGVGGLIITVLMLVLGGNALSNNGGTSSNFDVSANDIGAGSGIEVSPATTIINQTSDQNKLFMGFLMEDIQTVWDGFFQAEGLRYEYTSMVLFDDVVSTGCGNATSAVGPFYCPAPGDHKVYIDLGFYDQLATDYGAPGDFAQAYVIAHEVGHHIQSVTNISDQVRQAQQQNPAARNELSVRQELQADCFAGVWAFDANGRTTAEGLPILEEGDVAEGLGAAAAVGDDRIQAQAGMSIDPHTWTHGSAAARQAWFMTGFRTGDPDACDTFAASPEEVGL